MDIEFCNFFPYSVNIWATREAHNILNYIGGNVESKPTFHSRDKSYLLGCDVLSLFYMLFYFHWYFQNFWSIFMMDIIYICFAIMFSQVWIYIMLLMKVKEESEKVALKLNIQKTKIMASGPITSWEIDGETVETVLDFIFGGLQNHCRWWLQPWN